MTKHGTFDDWLRVFEHVHRADAELLAAIDELGPIATVPVTAAVMILRNDLLGAKYGSLEKRCERDLGAETAIRLSSCRDWVDGHYVGPRSEEVTA